MGVHKMPKESAEPGPGDGADSEPQPAAVGRRRFLKTAAIGGTAVGLLGGVSAAALATGRSSHGASAAGWGGPGHPGHDGHGTGPGGGTKTSARASASASSSASASKSATASAS